MRRRPIADKKLKIVATPIDSNSYGDKTILETFLKKLLTFSFPDIMIYHCD